ncbi:hypothetical protein EV695_2031 [Cocleimonas flava]|uniref:Uncharacterized protein n=1 Tax=Cocleimonas flava TaxID=634765 RepID=A0A4R1F9P8_9GAMM|nr:hypothetical protein EV695_2031 [Cocleimonas flava]
MDTIFALLVIALVYLWPMLLSEYSLFNYGNQKTIQLRIKFYLISYGIWFIFLYGNLYLALYLQPKAFQHSQECNLNLNECNEFFIRVTDFIYSSGNLYCHLLALPFAWFVLRWQSNIPNKVLKKERQKRASS